ncbi:XRE family transcriptional regulator [Dongia deserti]|uniref:XRE family transcriptional regulator n=1 Tax=Dongia deserti TaxID=2268030 RepID=UPI000E651AE0|nr:XRE family transcriptional regulator [Dongia deserti]
MSEVSEVARRLKELREQAGLTMRSVSDALGWSLTRYQHYEDRYKRKYLPFELARALEDMFVRQGVQAGAVLQLAGLEGSQTIPPRAGAAVVRPVSLNASAGQRDLPVQSAFREGSDGFWFIEGDAKEFVERPANLRGVANAFALYADGDSMQPRYFAGELLFVNPNRPITPNCFVAIEMADGRGQIRQFLRRTHDSIFVRRFNPDQEQKLSAPQVKRLYRITGSAELG